MKRTGDKPPPCGTPIVVAKKFPTSYPARIANCVFDNKRRRMRMASGGRISLQKSSNVPRRIQSKALLRSIASTLYLRV